MLRIYALLTVVMLTAAIKPVSAGIVEDLPDAVVCSVNDPTGIISWDELVFFLSAHTRNGDTLYKTLTSGPVLLIVAADGIIDAPNLSDCDGRNIQELVAAGRAFDLTR